ncbi:phosphatidate cytidylyltransferase [Microbacterium sp. ru370.1]|uniref:phosphatidate cytidylyltransferase n=1 Tax=unclassified Microbacterium TaxID=2609290 RepID=UPI000891D8F3|nr:MULTISPECIES: phosphatidate cytidylyltransferase [unclassified Microbacterium]SDO80308.1 phosphatidate cytidylyltransferase [Microbacterium sp. ru370.1]SIT89610.1 phosphatidate cytidylyltransferase [Microbacterium sp. RU1D]
MPDAPETGDAEPVDPLDARRAGSTRRPPTTGEGVTAIESQLRAMRSDAEQHIAHARAEFDQANERIKQRTGRDLIVATLIGVAIGAIVIASLIFVKWAFVLFAAAAMVLGVVEFSRALQVAGRRVDVVPQLVMGFVLLLSGFFLGAWVHWIAVVVAVVVVIVWRLVAQMFAADGRARIDVIGDVLVAGFVQLYVPFLTSVAMILLAQPRGEWWVLAFLILAVAADTGAYISGLTFGRGGRHPMAPRISPKKTWEGFAGACVAALVAGALLAVFMLQVPWWAGLIFGAVVLATATVGDLGESMVKRDLGIKDMSSWLPGHGGVLDRLDSILPSATAALVMFYLLAPLGVS